MKVDDPKNQVYSVLVPSFFMKKLTLQELFFQKRRLNRYDRVLIGDLETYWRRCGAATYIGTAGVCLHLLVNTDLLVRSGPSFAVAKIGVVALVGVVLGDLAKISFLYDRNESRLQEMLKQNDIEVYNPFAPT